jgi:predicted acyl esterase
MAWTSYRFAPGHKIHFIIASAAAGLFVVNTNTGNPIGPDIEVKVARQTIYHSAQYPSHIEVSTPQ